MKNKKISNLSMDFENITFQYIMGEFLIFIYCRRVYVLMCVSMFEKLTFTQVHRVKAQ
jgi:hypothetical protein